MRSIDDWRRSGGVRIALAFYADMNVTTLEVAVHACVELPLSEFPHAICISRVNT